MKNVSSLRNQGSTPYTVFSDDPLYHPFGDNSAFTLPALPFQPDVFTCPFPFQDDLDLAWTLGHASMSAASPSGPAQSTFAFHPDVFTCAFPFQDDLDLSLTLEGTSISATSPSDPPQSYTGGIEGIPGRHFPITASNGSSGRSRSIPRCPQVASAQLRRVVSSDDLTVPRSLYCSLPGGATFPPSGNSSYGDGYTHFTECLNIYNFDHDQPSSGPDHYPSPPVTNGGGHGKEFFDSESFRGASRPGSTIMLTGEDRLYHDWCLGVPNRTFDPDTLIHLNPVPFGSDGTGDDRNVSPATGTTSPQPQDLGNITEQVLSTSSVKRSGFRASVGSKAMVKACEKRRKKKGLHVCDVSGCNRNFTARHNLVLHHKSHANIRNEICRCGADFVTRGMLRRHLKTCGRNKKRNR